MRKLIAGQNTDILPDNYRQLLCHSSTFFVVAGSLREILRGLKIIHNIVDGKNETEANLEIFSIFGVDYKTGFNRESGILILRQ